MPDERDAGAAKNAQVEDVGASPQVDGACSDGDAQVDAAAGGGARVDDARVSGSAEVVRSQHYTLRPTTVSVSSAPRAGVDEAPADKAPSDPFVRAPKEDDDGYDPFSDRREEPRLFERDPWG